MKEKIKYSFIFYKR